MGQDDFRERAERFLRFVMDAPGYEAGNEWGNFRVFDGYALAAFALWDNPDVAWALFKESLDQMEEHLAREAADPGWHAHLADFTLQNLLRIEILFRHSRRERDADDLHQWKRLERLATGFLWNYGTRSENHNLLHLTGRYLVGGLWPQAQFSDGRSGALHHREARAGLFDWMRRWVLEGSSEWGADLYLNVNLLGLLNLVDFAPEAKMREAAAGVVDLILLEEACDTFAGAMCGAARRSYGCYRMSTKWSPSHSLQSLVFGCAPGDSFNRNFIGGVIAAATSSYRIPPAIRCIATHQPAGALEFSSSHPAGSWEAGGTPTGKHIWRSREAMLSVMQSCGGGARYTEHVWQITMGEDAILFGNHPALNSQWPVDWPPERVIASWGEEGESSAGPAEHPLWIPGNTPPGCEGDHRPGYWQGNGCGPRSFGAGRCGAMIYQISDSSLFDFTHLFIPERAMDQVKCVDRWIFVQAEQGYAAIWCSSPPIRTERGAWAGVEWKIHGTPQAVLAISGGQSEFDSLDAFEAMVRAVAPAFDTPSLVLTYVDPDSHINHRIGYDDPDVSVELPQERFKTPWGKMAKGDPRIFLDVNGVKYWRDMTSSLYAPVP